ncbi:TetR/AcrR family transcriptional regulator [Paenibacillus polymyxa]|uniref:TetR/AcrR family transcriptional regulator n=1 Tax=Paenibacillus polymyxa TaxID=1406 RepID=UPI002AB3AECB|nr:TetR/AcrR family transcriptional regulator [Paenibacillus polymyxa]MDY8023273.1 TetR/AcrR family transcriptional regulator [Paenibacillus polymyxa]
MRKLKNIEERILDRALYLMGINKTCDIPIRAIAKEANVNVSAINYYFRSKEEMLRLVKEFYIENTMTVLAILNNQNYKVEEKLVLAANEIMEYSLRFPGNMVILRDSKKRADMDEVSRKITDISAEIGKQLKELIRQLIPGDGACFNYKYLIFTSSINYPTEYDGIEDLGGTLLVEREDRMTYLKLLIRTLIST